MSSDLIVFQLAIPAAHGGNNNVDVDVIEPFTSQQQMDEAPLIAGLTPRDGPARSRNTSPPPVGVRQTRPQWQLFHPVYSMRSPQSR